MIENQRMVNQLRRVAIRLTGDRELQKDLLQVMCIHLVRVEADRPGQTWSWYLQSCLFRAYNFLRGGRSIDSIKRGHTLVPLGQRDDDANGDRGTCIEAVDPIDLRSELVTRDIVDLLLPQQTDVQQRILFLLIHGFGIREIAREMCISHPAVIKHRKRIARIAFDLLTDCGCSGANRRVPGHVRPRAA